MHRTALLTLLGAALMGAGWGQNGPPPQSRDREVQHEFPERIPAGTEIPVRTGQTIDVRNHSGGREHPGRVSQDVIGTDGKLLIPRGAEAELMVRNLSNNEITLDLASIRINGRRYQVNGAQADRFRGAGQGAKERTEESAGGATLYGTIVGTDSGTRSGGPGPVPDQVLTRGSTVNIPADAIVRFRLNHGLELESKR